MFKKNLESIRRKLNKGPKKDIPFGRDHHGIEIWNRTFTNLRGKLFPEDPKAFSNRELRQTKLTGNEKYKYWHIPAGTEYDPSDEDKEYQLVERDKPVASFTESFRDGAILLDLGSGGGAADRDMAKRFPEIQVHAVDHEYGDAIPRNRQDSPNLFFHQMSWNNLGFPTDYFDTILSVQGVGRYGVTDKAVAELTRVAKPGALLRIDKDRGMMGIPNFEDKLAEHGWDVFLVKESDGSSRSIAAVLSSKQ